MQNVSARSPALARYEQEALFQGAWRPALSRRDRSIITLASVITRGQTVGVAFYMRYAPNHGVTSREISRSLHIPPPMLRITHIS
ncbi:carboxymuconolactone decarboxylase family protein [Paraburkholderia rhynchosiae]|uniref:carboxymuconolactone decarboxylase family protein n=1 Tax=Paraburkholderia rhynchosiae TaxID=487049 RepID=UPI00387E7365